MTLPTNSDTHPCAEPQDVSTDLEEAADSCPPIYRAQDLPSAESATVLTGDRPSGPLHLGHYVGSLRNRLYLQDAYETYIMIADGQALTDHYETSHTVSNAIYEVVKDYLAVGLKPEKCVIFLQSQIPPLAELFFYYMNLVGLGRLQRNPTVKAEMVQKGYGDNVTAGFLCYPVSQAADITAFSRPGAQVIVPVGEDQLPMIELTNEIARKFNRLYPEYALPMTRAYLDTCPRLIGLDGQSKASKSLGNAIFLKDDLKTVREKVFSMFTDPGHIAVTDPGVVEGNVVFAYLDAFYPCKSQLEAWKAQYRQGGLGDVFLKNALYGALEAFLQPIGQKRAEISQEEIVHVLEVGNAKAQNRAEQVIQGVRSAMGLMRWKGPRH